MILLAAVRIPTEFFTKESIVTFTGMTGATFVIANGMQAAFHWNPRWLALLIALGLCLYFGPFQTSNAGPVEYILAVVNGFLVFLTVVGATSAVGSRQIPAATRVRVRGWFTPWF